MIMLIALIAGAIIGYTVARRRGGNRLDRIQYATGYGIAFLLGGLFLTIFIDRMV